MEEQLSLKLLIDENAQRVLMAEAGSDFVDLLLGLLLQPLGTLTGHLVETGYQMEGSLVELYSSIQNLSEADKISSSQKNSLLKLRAASLGNGPISGLLQGDAFAAVPKQVYVCDPTASKPFGSCDSTSSFFGASFPLYASSSPAFGVSSSPTFGSSSSPAFGAGSHDIKPSVAVHPYATEVRGTPCPTCKSSMRREFPLVVPQASILEGGVATYMVMDNLVVRPMSTISSIVLLKEFRVRDLGVLQERTVSVGKQEVLAIAAAALKSKTVLTDVFIRRTHIPPP